ncbi:MAG: AbrB/MazE/SpoVT family DNA-binding domain-containing protein [Candidatus Bipolaricaulia bacterium]
MSRSQIVSVRVDQKGRLMIPKMIREDLDIKLGDTFFLQREGKVLCYARPENPFDALALHAEKEYHEGRTRSLREFAQEHDIPLDVE